MVKILLCTCNGEKYLRQQLDSVLRQETEENFQLVLSDDASTDGTGEILTRYANAYPGKVRALCRETPSGGAWKHFLSLLSEEAGGAGQAGSGMPRSRGGGGAGGGREDAAEADYFMLSDQDDLWHPDKIQRSLTEMKAMEFFYGKDRPVLLHCDSAVVDEELRPIAPSFARYQKMSPERKRLRHLLVQNNVVGASIMMNAALAKLLRGVPAHAVMHDQWIALVAAAFGEISFLPEQLYLYRQHRQNVLGAEKGSVLGEVLGRFGLFRKDGRSKAEMDAHSQAVYRELFLQAESFLAMYRDRLSADQIRLLEAFTAIPGQSRMGKIRTILRYGFTYNLPHRTFGECLFI